MATAKRRHAMPASEKETRPANPVRHMAHAPVEKAAQEGEAQDANATVFVPLLKANTDEQTVTGIVLQPEVVDGQGDIYSADVIRKAAHKFLAAYNKATKLGLQHKDFKKRFELLESYTAPQELVIKNKTIKEGSWIMTVKVLDSKIWQKVKEGKITGFSIHGKAKVKKLVPSTIG
jgi:DNA adenine methylase